MALFAARASRARASAARRLARVSGLAGLRAALTDDDRPTRRRDATDEPDLRRLVVATEVPSARSIRRAMVAIVLVTAPAERFVPAPDDAFASKRANRRLRDRFSLMRLSTIVLS